MPRINDGLPEPQQSVHGPCRTPRTALQPSKPAKGLAARLNQARSANAAVGVVKAVPKALPNKPVTPVKGKLACKACMGTGVSSRGTECYPCNGTGKQLKGS